MDFTFSDEQRMAAEVLRALLDAECRPADLRRLLAAGAARDAGRWEKLAAMGFSGLLVPEAAGGLGLQPQDFVLAAEACGAAALPEPLVETVGVALPLLADFAGTPVADACLARALAGEITVAVGHPANPFVADADTAGALLLPAGDGLHLVEPAAARLTAQPSIDPFRRLFRVDFAAGPPLAAGPAVAAALERALDRGALFAAAQLVGLGQRAIELAVAYARERTQFGRPIGANQAVKHLLASAQVKIEFARPVVHAAAAEIVAGGLRGRARVSHAKLAAADAADAAVRAAVQVHGAMGYSWEVDVHLFLKRALALTYAWGEPGFHRARVAARVIGAPLGPDHTFSEAADA